MDLDDAYQNAAYIPGGDGYPDKWAAAAAVFRENAICETDLYYGESPRQVFDLFHPARLSKGVVIFVHGGYWLRFDKSFWSHLAGGPLAGGWTVAMPSYDLCPDVRITNIGQQIMSAISTIADRVPGPIRLIGHSAGGHLVARASVPQPAARWQDRLEKLVPVSPVADLAPLMQTSMNADLRIDAAEAQAESPVHLPAPQADTTVWVGGDERPVFLEQADALATHWGCRRVVTDGEHHFNVVEALALPDSPLTAEILG
jgi:acetyl esterase/lipase